MATKAALETLLRNRRLDRTLTLSPPAAAGEGRAPLGVQALDRLLLGGVPRGQVSEIAGPPSSGRTSLALGWLAAATRRGEAAALIDTFDRFDPASGAAAGLVLPRLLWVRGQAVSKTSGAVDPAWLPGVRAAAGPGTLIERSVDRALKALGLVLQAGLCTAVVLDLADLPQVGLRRIPAVTWLRVQRAIEGSETACVLIVPIPTARSAGGVTIITGSGQAGDIRAAGASPEGVLQPSIGAGWVRWAGAHDRSRRLAGVSIAARVVSPRRAMGGETSVDARLSQTV